MRKLPSLIVVSAVLLTSCSLHHNQSNADQSPLASTDASARTFGISSGSAYTSSDGIPYHINALTAPSDQTYYFAFDSKAMRASDLKALQIQAKYLVNHPHAKVRLEGNTDSRGSREYNIALGWGRAKTVARYFKQAGVHPRQLILLSYGKEHPAVDGDNDQAWALNRRVNVVYVVKQQ